MGMFLLLAALPPVVYGVILVGALGVGVWTAGKTEQMLGSHDPSVIVIDEIVGMLTTYFTAPIGILPLLVGFMFFRLFDVLKPFPQLERFPGGWGVMLDDLGAGILAHACVRLVLLIV
jgi:phosphatidylglycerophosphatase A